MVHITSGIICDEADVIAKLGEIEVGLSEISRAKLGEVKVGLSEISRSWKKLALRAAIYFDIY